MKKHRSISYYARREKLRSILGTTIRQRKAKGDARKPANENKPVTVEQDSLVDSDAGHVEQFAVGERSLI